jgi:hypothetical protein
MIENPEREPKPNGRKKFASGECQPNKVKQTMQTRIPCSHSLLSLTCQKFRTPAFRGELKFSTVSRLKQGVYEGSLQHTSSSSPGQDFPALRRVLPPSVRFIISSGQRLCEPIGFIRGLGLGRHSTINARSIAAFLQFSVI